ncbi:hypothetical protein NMG60_11000642 [Bertholletia excelsa]
MDIQEEAVGSKEHTPIMKGKRTKRPRQASPAVAGAASDNSSVATTSPSPVNSGDSTEEEEEDMANCLILLAQSGIDRRPPEPQKARVYVYQCKTCDRCFPSFQALGGHRASHKKPRPNTEEKDHHEEQLELDHESTTLSLQIPNRAVLPSNNVNSNSNNKSRVHECSICGAEFSSGQALGGHMRRHRPVSTAGTSSPDGSPEVKRSRNILDLDLNLPAPEDDRRGESKFTFGSSKEQVIVFSASSLVDCHY